MPRLDGTGPQGLGALRGRRRGQYEGAKPFTDDDSSCGLRLRRRRRGQGKGHCAPFRLVGANQDSGFVQSCIERLQSEIRAMQERLDHLKAGSGR